jgi:Fic family protein
MQQPHKISVYAIKEARESAERFDAFAFAVCIKLKFSSSVLHKSDIRHLKALFGIGTDKASKVLKNALKYGYVKEYGKYYVAVKLKAEYNNCQIEIQNITLKTVSKELIKLTICNHIGINEKVTSLKQKASNPKTLREYKTAKRLCDKWNVNNFETDGGLSYSAIAKKANVSIRTAILYIKELVESGKIKKKTFKLEFFNPNFIKSDKNIFESKNILFYQPTNKYYLAF